MKKITIILSLLVFIATVGYGQRTKPSERRGSNAKNAISVEVFGSDDEAFDITEIPEKWEEESAVVIAQLLDFSYHRTNKGFTTRETFRRRLKLLDKSSVDEFSQFYFRSYETVGIRVIKADGREIKIETDQAIEVTSEVPVIFRTFYTYNRSYFKLASPISPNNKLAVFFCFLGMYITRNLTRG